MTQYIQIEYSTDFDPIIIGLAEVVNVNQSAKFFARKQEFPPVLRTHPGIYGIPIIYGDGSVAGLKKVKVVVSLVFIMRLELPTPLSALTNFKPAKYLTSLSKF